MAWRCSCFSSRSGRVAWAIIVRPSPNGAGSILACGNDAGSYLGKLLSMGEPAVDDGGCPLWVALADIGGSLLHQRQQIGIADQIGDAELHQPGLTGDRKSTRLNSSHVRISYAVFCL